MSTELEREIRAAFADVVPREADPTLATSIRVGLKEPARPRPHLWPVLGRSVALLGIVALVALLIPQIGRLREAGPSTNPGQVVGASMSASPSARAAASPTPNPSNQLPGHKGMFGDLVNYQFRLVSDTVGWVATDSALYRTSDAGHTWSDVPLPTGVKPDAAVFTLDADTVVFAYGTSPVTTLSAPTPFLRSARPPSAMPPSTTSLMPRSDGSASITRPTADGRGQAPSSPRCRTAGRSWARSSEAVSCHSPWARLTISRSTIASGCRRTGARRGRHARSQPTPPCPQAP